MSVWKYRDRCSKEKFEFAKRLRANPTKSEALLWDALSYNKLGVKFRRQHVILGWIADFYCARYRLVIEIDGGSHSSLWQMKNDDYRDSAMRKHGFMVLRLKDKTVENNLPEALEQIRTAMARIQTQEAG
ncbi:MAG: endonuclease domain-containing protein [Candidatus Obscuribacterales bacterium]|nr:endonuclease domain-containing protein [Candidatus Obscuribacterales bacterium]